MEPIKAGIIGFGRVAGNHLNKMRETGLYDVVGVCDITESRREAAKAEGMQATDNLDDFLNWDIELVLITTHSSAHYADALKVANAKKHMLIEKPLAIRGHEAEEMVQAAKDNGVVLTAHHNRHYDGDYRLVKKAVREGAIGDIVSIENRTMGARPAVGYGVADYNQAWRITAAAGGGTLLDFGPHWVEQVLDLMEGHKVVSIFADVRHTKWGDSDDLFDITMVFENGVRARAAKSDISFYTLPYKWVVLGSDATLVCEKGGAEYVTVYGENYETKRKDAVEAQNLHANIARHLREGEDLIITADHALRVMQVLEAARQSGASGKSLDVEI
jgi:scyllo-inositol 2-dehydrogenase (NADP+)